LQPPETATAATIANTAIRIVFMNLLLARHIANSPAACESFVS
jgi:hypothetical protein